MFQLNMAGGKPVYLIASSTEEYSYWINGLQSFLAHRQANQGDAAPRPRLRIVDSLDLASDEYELDAAAHRLPARATSPAAATTATPTQQLYSADVTDFDDDDELEDDAVDRPSTTPADDDANPDVYVFTDGEGDGAYYGRVPLRTPLEFRLNNHLRRAAHRLAATEQQLVELKQAHDHLEGEAAAFFKLIHSKNDRIKELELRLAVADAAATAVADQHSATSQEPTPTVQQEPTPATQQEPTPTAQLEPTPAIQPVPVVEQQAPHEPQAQPQSPPPSDESRTQAQAEPWNPTRAPSITTLQPMNELLSAAAQKSEKQALAVTNRLLAAQEQLRHQEATIKELRETLSKRSQRMVYLLFITVALILYNLFH